MKIKTKFDLLQRVLVLREKGNHAWGFITAIAIGANGNIWYLIDGQHLAHEADIFATREEAIEFAEKRISEIDEGLKIK